MIYFHILKAFISNYFYLYPIKLYLIILIVFIWLVIYKLFKYKVSIDYKIYTSWINWLAVSIYFSLYIFCLLLWRYLAFGKVISLKDIYDLVKTFYFSHGILYSLLLISLLSLCFVISVKLRMILTKEVIKRHIWLLYYKQRPETKYKNILYNFSQKYSFQEIINYKCRIFLYTHMMHFINKYCNKKTLLQYLGIFIDKLTSNLWRFIKIIPKIILLLLFLYDCYYNNWVISKIFYYLPFYMLFNIWYNISDFLCNNHMQLDRIIYERYYCLDIIIYSNTTDEEEEMLENYIRQGFRYIYSEVDMYMDIHPIICLRRFCRLKDLDKDGNIVFENSYQGYMFTMTPEELQKYIDS